MRRCAAGLLILAMTLGVDAPAQTTQAPSETAAYLDAIGGMLDSDVATQIKTLRAFLKAYPDSVYRGEVEANLSNLEAFLIETDPVRKKEARDTELYLRAVEFARRLDPKDHIDLWTQFLKENPDSIYRAEVLVRIERLRASRPGAPPRAPGAPAPTSISPAPPPQSMPLAPDLPFKDPNKALLLATFPGIIVPGMGHWYSGDTTLAGVLTAVRLGGIGVMLPGVFRSNNAMILVGSLIAGFSYLVDVVDAPFSVDRYNEALEASSSRISQPIGTSKFNLCLEWTLRF